MTTANAFSVAERFFESWFEEVRGAAGRRPFPVSFRYGGDESSSILPAWQAELTEGPPTDGAADHMVTLVDPKTGLRIRCEVRTFRDYSAVEWVAYFKNTGATETPIIEDILPLDVAFEVPGGVSATLHYARGTDARNDDFAPLEHALGEGAVHRFGSVRGRSSDGNLPFFNLAMGDGGVIGAIGWTGDWAANFSRNDDRITVRAGMKRTHLRLLPGEEIRTPRILLLFWEGERIDGHNLMRRFVLAHHAPRPNGQLVKAPICEGYWGASPVKDQIAKVRWIRDTDLPIEYFWIDAGWNGDHKPFDPTNIDAGWWEQSGNWYPNEQLYPNGLRPLGDACEAAGIGFLVWIEPERVHTNTKWAREHPEWLLGLPGYDDYLLNLGDPAARRFLTDFVSDWISSNGITLLRQDFNIAPARYWRAADAPDRIGMHEIRHIEGLYAYWDELLARHPGLIIDCVSAGDRRLDLETISRSITLWRSDIQVFAPSPLAQQCHSQALAPWGLIAPANCQIVDRYHFRSAFGPGIVVNWSNFGVKEGSDAEVSRVARKLLHEYQSVREYFYGDFYPLTPHSLAEDAWVVWQFDRPDTGEGMLLAIRRQSLEDRATAVLHGLDPDEVYEMRSLDRGTTIRLSGHTLTREGLTVEVPSVLDSELIVYKRLGLE